MKNLIWTFVAAVSLGPSARAEMDVEGLLAQMTLEEKVGQLVQVSAATEKNAAATDASGQRLTDAVLARIRSGEVGALIGACGIGNYNLAQRTAKSSRLGIPIMVGHDLIHGVLTQYPTPLALSCAWDTNLWYRAGRLIAAEAPLKGCDWTFAPMLDIARDARWGRIVECAGQDPHLASLYAAATVRGIQEPVGGRRMAACLKHYVGYGAAVGGRDYDEAEMSVETLHRIYLPPFVAGIAADAFTVMPGFHSLNGSPCSASRYLLTDVLRGELGFTGFCVSDMGAVWEIGPKGHGIARDEVDAAAKCVNAGMNMEMTRRNEFCYSAGLAQAVRDGRVAMKTLDDRVRDVLRIKVKMGLFERPFIDERYSADLEASLAFAREAAAKSVVLVKNAGDVLPLAKTTKVVLAGRFAASAHDMRGAWSAYFENVRNTSVRDGLLADGVALVETPAEADVVVACVGESQRRNGENRSYADVSFDAGDLAVVREAKKSGKPVVALVFCGRPLAMAELFEEADAVMIVWNAGSCGGWGIADVLTGLAEPTGRLTTDFPRVSGQCPIYYNRMATGRPYGSGRFCVHYEDVPFEPLLPFGRGLTYTSFAYAGARAERQGDQVLFSAEIANVGRRRGTETVQLYVHERFTETVRPIRELRGFEKVTLEAGERRRVTVTAKLPAGDYEYVLAADSRAAGVQGEVR